MEYNEKQIHIMDTAAKLFAAKGFNGTSVRDIAEAAEVNLAMISYYFGSKEKLLEAVFVYRSEFFKLQLESMIQNKELTPLQKMESLIDEYINKLTSQQYFNTIMLREQMKNSNPLVIAQIYNLKNRNMLLIQELIEEGQKKGVFTNDINIYLLMSTMVGIANHVHMTKQYFAEKQGLQGLSEEALMKKIQMILSQHIKKIFKTILTNEA